MDGETVARKVVRTLRDMGVRHVFGVPSGGWVDYMEAIRETDGIDFVLTSHEGGASFMADVCGRITGAPGVCFGTFGPGATNLATGVGGALLDRSPMIALTDEMGAAMRGRTVQMGIDHQALFAPITKKTTRLDAGNVEAILAEAAAIATEARPGPAHVGLPVGMSAEPAGEGERGVRVTRAAEPDPEQVAALAAAFRAARKPVLAVGLGAARIGVEARIAALAERFGLPVVLTPMAKGMLAESHPNYAGVLFHALSDEVGKTHAEADLVVAIGYDPVEFNYESWMRDGLALASIDVAPADIDRARYPVVADVVGDIGAGLAALEAVEASRKDWVLEDVAALQSAISSVTLRPASAGACAAAASRSWTTPSTTIAARAVSPCR
jgi:acetolactate synthase-1/2/3 large subunit